MNIKLGVKAKTVIPIAAILVIALSVLAVFNYFSQVAILNREADETLRGIVNSSQGILDERLKQYQQMATLVAGMPTTAQVFARGDRQRLITEFSGGFQVLKKEFGIAQFQFHRPPATSFLRLHQLEKYGDDLTTIRHTVVYANKNRIPARGLEVGRGGLGLRGVVPVFSQGSHIGTVEFGGDLAPAIDEAKRVFDVDLGVLLSLSAEAQSWPEWHKQSKVIADQVLFYSTKPYLIQEAVNPALLAATKAAARGVFIQTGTYMGKNYYLALAPLKDYSGKAIGYLCVFKDRTELVGKIRKVLAINIIIYLVLLGLISWAIDASLRKTVLDPVLQLTAAADDVSMGRLNEKIEVKTNDEISELAKSLDRMRVSMKKLLE
jgi:HAMP domain-containing protein